MFVSKLPKVGRIIASASPLPLAPSHRGAADLYVSNGHHTRRTSATGLPKPPQPQDEARKDADFLASAPGWARRFASMRARGEHFAAFNLLSEVQRHTERLVKLPQSDFRAAWDGLMQIAADSEAKSGLADWMLETAQARLQVAKNSDYRFIDGPRADDLHAAISQAVQALSLQVDAGSESATTLQFWQQLETELRFVLPEMFRRVEQPPEVLGELALEQAHLLTRPLLTAGRSCTKLVGGWLDNLVYDAGAKGIAQLPWLAQLGKTHGVDASVVDAMVMRCATRSINRAGLVHQPLHELSTGQTETFLACYIENLLNEARDTRIVKVVGHYEEHGPDHPNHFPLEDLRSLPDLVARLGLSEAQIQALVSAVEQASEVFVHLLESEWPKSRDRLESADFLRNNHAAWLFASGLQRQVRDARHVEMIAFGLRDADERKGWRWPEPIEHRAATFGALAQAARAAGVDDLAVRQAWKATHSAAYEAAKGQLAACAGVRDRARERFDKATDEAEQAEQKLAKVSEVAVI